MLMTWWSPEKETFIWLIIIFIVQTRSVADPIRTAMFSKGTQNSLRKAENFVAELSV